jgi:hypothetical protein
MDRFILMYRGADRSPRADVEAYRSIPGVRILDDSSPIMLLVEGPEDRLQRAVNSTHGWVMDRDLELELPNPHPGIGSVHPKRRKR